MHDHRIWIASAAALLLSSLPSFAGPCTQAIDAAQARVDARIEADARLGRTAPESTGALLHHQPTPGSIAQAEQKLGEGRHVEAALSLLSEARKADKANNAAGCHEALDKINALFR
ncbi:hypothetical protein [Microvirga terricola]|uniref:Small metal-binding protein n=1 Tax=Microvirga terricola TaxID=2719797 RepID=A0ABX0VBF2_9HYPH|nr:hypothetical protein [Microvirga terricola]NIX77183.1 hypothetical protein [Microvirga terricola]